MHSHRGQSDEERFEAEQTSGTLELASRFGAAARGLWPVGLVVLLSLLPQAFIAATNLAPEYDESIYLDISENLYRTGVPIVSYEGGFPFFQHPTLSLLIFSLPFRLNLDSLVAFRAVSSLFAAGTIFLTFLLGRSAGGRRTPILAALLLAFAPLFLAYSHSVYMDVILGFLLLLSAYFFVRANEQGKATFWLLSGIFLGLALWVKYLAAIAVLIYLAYLFIRHRWSTARRRETYMLLGPALGLLLLWPVYGLVLDQHQFLVELQRWVTFGKNNLHDARVGIGVLEYGLKFIRSISLPIVLLLAFATGSKVLAMSRQRTLRITGLFTHLYLVIWVLFVALLMPIKDMRYLMPAIPWIALSAAGGMNALAGRLEDRWPKNAWVFYVVLAGFVATAYLPFLGRVPAVGTLYRPSPFLSRLNPVDNGFREVGTYIAQLTPSDEIITVNRIGPQIGHLAGRHYRILEFESYNEVLASLERSRVVVRDGPWLLPYLDGAQKREFLSRLDSDFQVNGTFDLGRDEYTTTIFVRRETQENAYRP